MIHRPCTTAVVQARAAQKGHLAEAWRVFSVARPAADLSGGLLLLEEIGEPTYRVIA